MDLNFKFERQKKMGFDSILSPGCTGKVYNTGHFSPYSPSMESCFITDISNRSPMTFKESAKKIFTEGIVKNSIENLSMSMFLVGGFVGSKSQAGGSSHRGREIFNIWDIICDKMKGYNGYRENEYPSSFFKKPTDDQRGVSSDLKIKETNKDSKTKFADVTAVSSECFLADNYRRFTDKQFQINEPKGSLQKSQSSSNTGCKTHPLVHKEEQTPDSVLSHFSKTNTINAPSVSAVEPPSENQPSNTDSPDVNSELMPNQTDAPCTVRTLGNRKIHMFEEMGATSCDLVSGVSAKKLPTECKMVTYVKNRLNSLSLESECSCCSDCSCDSDTKKVRTLSDCSVDSDDSFIIFDGTNCCDDALQEESEDDFSDDESSDDDMDEPEFTYIPIESGCMNTTSENYLESVNARWNLNYASAGEKTKKISSKKVTFASGKDLVKVKTLVVWAFAHRASRKGNWDQVVLDRDRFQARINRLAQTLSPILEPEHRRQIYNQRFNNN